MYFLDIFLAMMPREHALRKVFIAPIDVCINVIENTMTMGAASFVDFMVSFMVLTQRLLNFIDCISMAGGCDATVTPANATTLTRAPMLNGDSFVTVSFPSMASITATVTPSMRTAWRPDSRRSWPWAGAAAVSRGRWPLRHGLEDDVPAQISS